MIRVNRRRRDASDEIIRPPATWRATADVATARAIVDGPSHVADDAIYAHNQARAALEELFFFKCAYCERQLEEVGWDVEHFRPKSAVTLADGSQRYGYYWLAYTWANLYASCKPCNESRRDLPTYDDPSTLPARGKSTQFPVADEVLRATGPGPSAERRLLLDPCADWPEKHLSFGLDGRPVVRHNSTKGRTSIEVFGLDRRRMNLARRARIELALRLVKDHGVPLDGLLETLGGSDQTFAGAVRSIVRDPAAFGV